MTSTNCLRLRNNLIFKLTFRIDINIIRVVYKQSVRSFELPYVATGKRSAISLTRRSRVLLSSATRILIVKYKYRHDVYGLSCYTDLLIHQMSKPWDDRGMLAILSILIIFHNFCLCIFFVHVEVTLISNTVTLQGNS